MDVVNLELKIPPVLVFLAIALGMAGTASVSEIQTLPPSVMLPIAVLLACTGIGVAVAGVLTFRRHRTTVNPLHLHNTSRLVTAGVYRLTRNPMYLGLLMLLLSWACYLNNPFSLALAWLFVPYMNRFQITPEETHLLSTFGKAFEQYTARVRRWL